MAYGRTSKGALQRLAETVGDQSYAWDQVLPFYQKSMNFAPPDDRTRLSNATPSYDSKAVARGGPLSVNFPAYAESWSTWVVKGLAAIGISPGRALVEGALSGSTWQLMTVDHATGRRSSSNSAFLSPVSRRNNLVVFTDTMAQHIIFDGKKAATGVSVTNGNTKFTLAAKKEVILSAGVFQSPQLLMVSGVGPKDVLQQHQIPVVADRPGVGQGMRDHVLLPITYQVNLASPDLTSGNAVADFNDHARGALTNPGGDLVGLEKIPSDLRANWSPETKSGKRASGTIAPGS